MRYSNFPGSCEPSNDWVSAQSPFDMTIWLTPYFYWSSSDCREHSEYHYLRVFTIFSFLGSPPHPQCYHHFYCCILMIHIEPLAFLLGFFLLSLPSLSQELDFPKAYTHRFNITSLNYQLIYIITYKETVLVRNVVK